MGVAVITPPSSLVELDLAKLHLRVDGEAEDSLITAYLAAASAHIDGPGAYLGRAVGTQTLEMSAPGFPRGACPVTVPYGPVKSVSSVKYRDDLGDEVIMPGEDYQVDDPFLIPSPSLTWPATDLSVKSLRIRWVAGYEATPAPIVAAVLLMVGDMYANRETVVVGLTAGAIPMSTTVENLLRPYRVLGV